MVAKIVSIAGSGDPFWHGPPEHSRVHVILLLTYTDEQGRRFFRTSLDAPLQELRTDLDFEMLNEAITCNLRRAPNVLTIEPKMFSKLPKPKPTRLDTAYPVVLLG